MKRPGWSLNSRITVVVLLCLGFLLLVTKADEYQRSVRRAREVASTRDLTRIRDAICAGHFKVIRQVRPKLACACCDKVVQAAAPSRHIERGMAGPGLLAHLLVSKYADHLPLYSQAEIYARDGVKLDRSTMAEWTGGCSRLLQPLVEALRRHVMSAAKLHADDTPVPVLAPGNGKTKTGRLWTYVRDDRPWGDRTPPAVWFAYTPDRKGEQGPLCPTTGLLLQSGYHYQFPFVKVMFGLGRLVNFFLQHA